MTEKRNTGSKTNDFFVNIISSFLFYERNLNWVYNYIHYFRLEAEQAFWSYIYRSEGIPDFNRCNPNQIYVYLVL